jgi:hypothetical protein
MSLAVAYAAAIRDNAQDEGIPIPAELVASFAADYNAIIDSLTKPHHEDHHNPVRPQPCA